MTTENKKTTKKRFRQSFVLGFFVVFLFVGLYGHVKAQEVGDMVSIKVNDKGVAVPTLKGYLEQVAYSIKYFSFEEFYNVTLKNAIAQTFWSATSKALNTIAYDTATWIGSGGKGQKPLFVTEGWDKYLANVGDNFAGEYIETLSKQWDANLCNPSFDIKIKILGGLAGPYRKKAPACTFTQMKKNWESELARPDFLNRFQNMFEPNSNDLGIALSLQTNLIEASNRKADLARTELVAKKGWLDVRNIAGIQQGMPTEGTVNYELNKDAFMRANLMTKTTATFADAVNVFLNQLASTLFSRMLQKLTGAPVSSPYAGDYGLINYSAGGGSGGTEAAKEQFRKIVEPDFTVRGDYDILAELTMCPDPTKAGPTNCVITDKFRQAVADRMTVGEAMKQGYLNPEAIFGFMADGLEPKYNEGYPYRSMLILRKFRILPVGWEVAAQYIKDNPSLGVKNLKDLVDCYSFGLSWCKGLVDPDWVLKAPLNYCKKEGFGPEIMSENITGEGDDSELMISRNDNYCADEQSCVKEKADGSCDIYGYCTEEKRKWNFGSNSCEPIYNTCQTFRSRQGDTVSYLQNGLDYGDCSADVAGCKEYAMGSSDNDNFYNDTDNVVNWGLSKASSTFNRNLNDCDTKGEGCYQFIRTEMGNGANLFGGFEDLFGATDDDTAAFGDKSVRLTGDIATTVPAFKIDVDLKGYYYTFSVSAKNCGTGGMIWIGDSSISYSSSTLETTDQWQRFAVSHYYNKKNESNVGKVWVGITDTDDGCLIDGVQVEKSKNPTVFSEYAQAGVIYEKLLPNYLEYACYSPGSNYSLRDDAPAICNDFARKCSADEVGCKMFTAKDDDMTIPASVIPTDYCDASCVGYDEYLQSESVFDSQRSAYLIPDKAKICGAEAVGCDQFTNLDKIGSSTQSEKVNEYGAEAIEYYSELRQCVKGNDAACAEFYTWEGSSETGFQLKVYQLKADASDEPSITSDALYDGKACASSTYGNLNNPMCFEFYNKTGHVSYKFLPYTITCSDNCHPYRRTAINIDESATTQAACSAVVCSDGATACSASICSDNSSDEKGGCWDTVLSNCNVCLNGGKWSVAGQACIYDAIPGEGKTCAATQDGCREYNGNSGANIQTVLQSDFEGSTSGWQGVSGTQVITDSESLKSGENSLKVSGDDGDAGIFYDISGIVKKDKSYHLAFLIKGNGSTDKIADVYFDSGIASSSFATTSSAEIGLAINADWSFYELNLAILDHEVTPDEKLIVKTNGDFFIDNIILTEITDRYYLIKGSWLVPDVCNNDIFGNYMGPTHNLGCAEYSVEGDNNKHYLRQFSSLCQESAIGCEMMIDTHNSSSTVDDNIAYAVFSKDKECAKEEKGCERMGEVYSYASGTIEKLYTDVYKINDPDDDKARCFADQVGCEEWSADMESNTGGVSLSYFKDPFDMTCEWRPRASSTELGWYRKKISRCGGVEDGHICKSDKDCASESSETMKDCKLHNTDIACYVDNQKTIGYGGLGNIANQPGDDWVGTCPSSQSTCTEYVDPISNFSSNAIFNSDFSQNVDSASGNNVPDGWSAVTDGTQSVSLEPYTLYVFSVESDTDFSATVNGSNLTLLNENNSFVAGGGIAISVNDNRISKSFYSNNSRTATVQVSSADVNSSNRVSLRKSVVDYQLSENVNRDECNGFLNPSDGCVLFNERKKDKTSYSSLIYDVDTSSTTLSSVVGQNDSNALLKVSPDRACEKWLACKSYVKDENDNNVCYGVGLCDSFDSNGVCNNFIVPRDKNQEMSSVNAGDYRNISGYSEVGSAGNYFKKGMLPLSAMKQEGGMSLVPNGDFESFDADKYPQGWNTASNIAWNKNLFSVIDNPVAAQTEGVKYAGKGRAFSKYSPAAGEMESDFIDIEPSGEYYFSADINTLNFFAKDNVPLTLDVKIKSYNSTGQEINSFVVATSASGKDWSQVVHVFSTASNASRIKIQFLGWVNNSSLCSGVGDTCSGNAYIDNVVIKPALMVRKTASFYDTIVPTCRLYPESDSLSCEYYEDSGIKKKGRYGYCLEYDRYPGNPNACLLWYPVDRVRGDWEENVVGYQGKTPVYYCEEAILLKPVEYRESKNVFPGQCVPDTGMPVCATSESYSDGSLWGGIAPSGYVKVDNPYTGSDCSRKVGWRDCWFKPSGVLLKRVPVIDGWDSGWYISNGSLDTDKEKEMGLKFYDPISGELFDDILGYCSKVVQTVTSVGGNKYWSGRVYLGSAYKTVDQNYGYNYDSSPFGSITKPLQKNVSGWDGGSADGIQPVYMTNNTKMPRAGFPYHFNSAEPGFVFGACSISARLCLGTSGISSTDNKADCQPGEGLCVAISHDVSPTNSIKRIFARSYGVWKWDSDESRYVTVSNEDWSEPTTKCPDTGRPAYDDDYCGIPPRADNLFISGENGDTFFEKSGLVNLTFNSIIDSQQMPLVMYSVNWGDGNSDTVSGIEMMPRMGTDDPHSLYYLYSYWDLKAKNSVDNDDGENTVYCGEGGNKTATNANGETITVNATSTVDYCAIKPKVKLKDNWGWCTESRGDLGTDDINGPCSFDNKCSNSNVDCTVGGNSVCGTGYCVDGYYEYPGWIIVTER